MADFGVTGEVVVTSEKAEAAFDRVGDKATQMANEVASAAGKAGQAVDGVGAGAEKSAEKFTRAESRMRDAIKRSTQELQLLGKTASEKLEFNIQAKGLDASKFAPYIEELKKAEQAQRIATGGLDKMGVSAAQTAAALRGVPAQFTDIITSLQGGQAPLTVFLQQGGQLKDMFGGAGAAARALGGYVVGLINPFTLAAVAVGGLGLAYAAGSKEADAYRLAMVGTGNAAGTTAGQLKSYAQEISGVIGTQGKAAESLAAFVSTGRVSRDVLKEASQAAIAWERATGQAVSTTAKQFADLGKDPLQAVLKLNEGTNFLTESVYRQIKSLDEQGRTAEAAAVAQRAYADALTGRSATITQNLGYIEAAWKGITDAAKKSWDAMLNVGRASTPADATAELRTRLMRQQEELAAKKAINPYADTRGMEKGIEILKQRLGLLESDERQTRRLAEAEAERAKQMQATAAWDKEGAKYLTDKAKLERDLTVARNEGLAAGKSQAEIEQRMAQIRESYAKKGGSGGIAAENKDLRDQQRIFAELADVSSTYYADLEKAQQQRAKGNLSEAQYVKYVEELIQKQPFAVAAAKAHAEAIKEEAKAAAESSKALSAWAEARAKESQGLQNQINARREEVSMMDMTAEAVAAYTQAKYEQQAAEKEAYAAALESASFYAGEYAEAYNIAAEAARNQAKQLRELGGLEVEKVNKDAAKKAKDEWERAADDINRSLTDALLRGFESGKDFAKNLRDTVVNMFNTMVLRPVISAIVNPVAGAVTGMMGLSGTQGGGNSVMGGIQTASNLNTLYGAGSQALFGGAAGASAASLGYANIVGMAGGDAIGALAAANGMWAGVATGAQAAAQAAIASNAAMAAGTAAALPAGTTAAAAGAGAGGASGALAAIPGWGWALAGVAALGMLAKKFDDSGTYHTGGAAQYSAATGLRTSLGFRDNEEGLPSYNPNDNIDNQFGTGFGYVERGDQAISTASGIAQGLSATLDGVAVAFGEKAGYAVATAFADDTSKDGAWGALRISKDGQDLLNWNDTRESKWAPREFANGEDGYKEYLAEIAKDTRTVLLDMDLPSWADTMLESIGDAASMDQLSATLQQIGAIQTVFVQLGKTIDGFAGMTDEAFEALMRASGGLESLAANAGTYYENFYSEAEKTAAVTRSVSESLAQVGLAMPATRDEFRALVESQLALGESGAEAVAALLGVSGAFASVVPAAEQAAEAISQIMQNLLRDRGRLEADLLRAQGNIAGADAANRLIDIAGYTEAETALYDYNAALRAQIEALEQSAEAAIRSAEAAAEASRIAVQAERNLIDARAQAAQQAYSAAQAATSASLSSVDRAVGAQREGYDAARSAALEAAQEVKSLIDTLSDGIKGLYGEVESARTASAVEGLAFIDNALRNARATGYLPDSAALNDAVTSARAGIGAKQYASQADKDFDRLVLAGQLKELNGYAEPQLTAAEQAARSAEDQIKALDDILRNARDQVDELRGIDTSVKTIPEALAALQAALVAESQAQTQAFLAGTVASLSSGQIKPQDAIKQLEGKGAVVPREQWTDLAGTQAWVSTGGATALGGTPTSGLDAMISSKTGAQFTVRTATDYVNDAERKGDLRAIYDAAVLHGISSTSLDAMMGWPGGTALDWAKSQGLPAFAVGTNYVPRDMVARIHEGEAIVPKAYNPAAGGSGGQSNARLEALIEKLNAEVAELKGLQRDSNRNTRRTAEAVNGNPDAPILVTTV